MTFYISSGRECETGILWYAREGSGDGDELCLQFVIVIGGGESYIFADERDTHLRERIREQAAAASRAVGILDGLFNVWREFDISCLDIPALRTACHDKRRLFHLGARLLEEKLANLCFRHAGESFSL